ncbi:11648_t:CDS:1, partial [Racocetra persica]
NHFTICTINELLTLLQKNTNFDFSNSVVDQENENIKHQNSQESDSSISISTDERVNSKSQKKRKALSPV